MHVDDLLLARNARMEKVKRALCGCLDMKDLGELHYFLGVRMIQNHEKGSIWIGQQVYFENLYILYYRNLVEIRQTL